MLPMRDYALKQALKGITTPEEVARVLHSGETLSEPGGKTL